MQALQLDILKPCMQDWNAMQQEDKGRFCNACATTVIDFTEMSDAALLQFFSDKSNRNVCGRMYADQLQNKLKPFAKRRNFYTLCMGMLFSFLLKWGGTEAQTVQRQDVYASPLHGQNKPLAIAQSVQVSAYNYICAITGKVWDENGTPIASAKLMVLGTDKTTITQPDGNFVFLAQLDDQKIRIAAEGYQPTTIELKPSVTHYEVVLKKVAKAMSPKPIIMGKIVAPRTLK